MGRNKKLRKGIGSLEKQIEKHEKKIADYPGPNYSLIGYWENEIKRMKMERQEKEGKIKKK